MINKFDNEYLRVCNNVLNEGFWEYNPRTEKKCLKIHGDMMKFDFSKGGFPLLTLRKMYTKGIIGELLGFIRGYDNAVDFRNVGCNLWNANANESKDWLVNTNRKGEDDLGRIYGVQARKWNKYSRIEAHQWGHDWMPAEIVCDTVDQLKIVIDKISQGIDDRRLIVTHWNPGELDKMALLPCHMFYQFGLRGKYLDLIMYQRSCDMALGIPSNIASYAILMALICRITNKEAGTFTHFLGNAHFYEDQMDGTKEMITRQPLESSNLWINPEIKTLEDLESWVTVDDIQIRDYVSHPAIKFPFSK